MRNETKMEKEELQKQEQRSKNQHNNNNEINEMCAQQLHKRYIAEQKMQNV